MSKKKRKYPQKKKSSDKCNPQTIALITAILTLIRTVIELLNQLLKILNND